MTLIPKNHFALSRTDYIKGIVEGRYKNEWPEALSIERIPATVANLAPMQEKLSERWHWKDQDRYNDGSLPDKLAHTETALFRLLYNDEPIGYTLVTAPPPSIKERFWGAANHSVIEVENLGLFPGQEGGGRGKAYFEMLFERYFKNYDVVYWSQHETHSPTLRRFYQEKMGMELLATDMVRDFRPKVGARA